MVNKEDYILRITQASPAQLVVINYELIIAFLDEALLADDKSVFAAEIDRARNGLAQLIKALNFEISLAQDLFQIYEYVNARLITAYFGYDRAAVSESRALLETLLIGWREAAAKEAPQEDETGSAPQVYAGLTYQKDGLSEYIVQNDGRGYQA